MISSLPVIGGLLVTRDTLDPWSRKSLWHDDGMDYNWNIIDWHLWTLLNSSFMALRYLNLLLLAFSNSMLLALIKTLKQNKTKHHKIQTNKKTQQQNKPTSWVFCTHVCVCTIFIPGATETRRREQICWDCSTDGCKELWGDRMTSQVLLATESAFQTTHIPPCLYF